MAFVIKKKGQPAVTIPAWSSFVNKKPIEVQPGAPAGATTGSLPGVGNDGVLALDARDTEWPTTVSHGGTEP